MYLLPVGVDKLGVEVCRTLAQAIEGVDVVMMLRIQHERLGGECLIPARGNIGRTIWAQSARVGVDGSRSDRHAPGPNQPRRRKWRPMSQMDRGR